ncbi:hypothetical protein C6P40_005233, partial [Pichia californica]
MVSPLFTSLLLAIDLACASSSSSSSSSKEYSSFANLLQFDNVGYYGYFYPVSTIEALSDGSCDCAKDYDNPTIFNGPIAPLDAELTVHFRGPINLLKFGYYVTSSYSFGDTSGSWERLAYYDSVEQTADNVTFLANYGNENTCLGNAFDYVDSTGLKKANDSEILSNTTVPFAHEFAIASNITCDGTDDCGAYRTDGQAYHGFYGINKMFLFEFNAPHDTSEESKSNKSDGYDMPAIWLLNAQIPRTSQYPLNANCTSWNSGSGEFDIFEVMNYTERNHFFSTIHDFQGSGDIGTGLQNWGYLERTPDSTMIGGVVFGEDKTITVFLSNSTSIDSTISNSDLNDWLSVLEKETENKTTLKSVSNPVPSTTEKSTKTSTKTSTVSSISSSSKNDAGLLLIPSSSFFGTIASVIF